jgi:hypothetical protein
MTLEFLDKMSDDELLQVRARADELLKAHDAERKARALEDAKAIRKEAEAKERALLASVGLPFKAATPRRRRVGSGKHGGGDGAVKNATKRAG